MRIVVNNIAASKTGALSILVDFYEAVKKYGMEHKWIFLVGGDYIASTENIEVLVMSQVKKSQKNRLLFDLVTGSRFIESMEPDVVFSMQNTLTRGKIHKKDGSHIWQYLYVHQPLGFQKMKKFSFFVKEEREYAIYQYLIGSLIDASIKRADFTIVQTKWMKEAVIEKTNISPRKIQSVLPNVPDLSEYEGKERFRSNLFFFPSGEILYKNHECILKASALLNKKNITDYKIRFTLQGLWDVTKRVYEDPCQNVEWMGRVDREKVFGYYGESTLIFPSYIETFGFPLAEARQLGTIILASDCPFCHEVLEDYENAYFFHPFKEAELAELMEKVIKGEITKREVKKEKKCSENGYKEIIDIITGKNGEYHEFYETGNR